MHAKSEFRFRDYETPCRLWLGQINRNGYGFFEVREKGRKRKVMAHIAYYELRFGPVPKGEFLDHLCRNRSCIEHTEPVSPRVNTLRGEGPTATNARKTHCIRGHELPPKHNGRRTCLVCRRLKRTDPRQLELLLTDESTPAVVCALTPSRDRGLISSVQSRPAHSRSTRVTI